MEEVKGSDTIAEVVTAIAVVVVAVGSVAMVEAVADNVVVIEVVVIMVQLQHTRLKSLNSLMLADYPIAIDNAITYHATRRLVVLVVVSLN